MHCDLWSTSCSREAEPFTVPVEKVTESSAVAQGLDWFWEMLKLVLASAVLPGRDLPKLIFYEHLSHLSRDTWLGFERALVVHNRCSSPF